MTALREALKGVAVLLAVLTITTILIVGLLNIVYRDIDHHGFVTAYASTPSHVLIAIDPAFMGKEEALALRIPSNGPPLPDLSFDSRSFRFVTVTTSGDRITRITERPFPTKDGRGESKVIWEAPR